MKIIAQLLSADKLQYSKEELEAEEVLVDAELDAVPESDEEIEADDLEIENDEALEASDAEIADSTEACDNLDECAQSLESLVEFLNMESADLTQREYSMIMATANGYLEKAGIDSGVMSFEESTALTTVPREAAKSTLGEKAAQLKAAAIAAVQKLIAAVGQWITNQFNQVKRTRQQLVGLAKALESSDLPHANVTLPAKFAKAVAPDVLPKLARASHGILTERMKALAQMAHAFQSPDVERSLATVTFPAVELDGLPGEPSYEGFSIKEDIDHLWEKAQFKVAGSFVGDAEISYGFNAQRARGEVGGMIKLLDGVLETQGRWNTLAADLKKAAGSSGTNWADNAVRKLGVGAAGRMFEQGPKRFISYMTTLIGLRAGAYAYVLKHGTTESTVVEPEAAKA